MIDPALVPLGALGWLQVKHLACDYPLQTEYQIENKGTYGHPAGLIHAGTHAIASLPVFLFYPTAPLWAAALLIAEFLAHYHIDWLKSTLGRRFGWTTSKRQYWWALGADQFAHQITYLAMVAALILIDRT